MEQAKISLGSRTDINFIPLEEIDIREKSRFTGIAELICENIISGDLATAKDYYSQARFENPDVSNTVFYDNFSRRISNSYFDFANSEIDSLDPAKSWHGSTIDTIEIAISNALHFSPSHPLEEITKARLLIKKADHAYQFIKSGQILAAVYNWKDCLDEAKPKISSSRDIGEGTLSEFSVDLEIFNMYCDKANEDVDQIENGFDSLEKQGEGLIIIFTVIILSLVLAALAI